MPRLRLQPQKSTLKRRRGVMCRFVIRKAGHPPCHLKKLVGGFCWLVWKVWPQKSQKSKSKPRKFQVEGVFLVKCERRNQSVNGTPTWFWTITQSVKPLFLAYLKESGSAENYRTWPPFCRMSCQISEVRSRVVGSLGFIQPLL